MTEKLNKSGYYIITRRARLYTNYTKYLKITQEIYNEVILKYYNLLFEHLELLELSNQNCLRELEKLTIKSKDGNVPENYFDLNVPVYFRRVAINQAIGQVRAYISKLENSKKDENSKVPKKATHFNASMTFYKGMYKTVSNDTIKIKLFNGTDWEWYTSKIKSNKKGKDNNFESMDSILSPTIVINKEYAMIHMPVKELIEDVSPVKERMTSENVRVCGVAFSNSDSFAICVVLDENKKLIKSKFVKGGNEYKERTTKILAKIRKHRKDAKNLLKEKDHKRYWQKLNYISDWYAHKVSKDIVDFCLENGVKVISVADMKEDANKAFSRKVGKYSPIYLRRRIEQYLQYKAYKNGIIITKVRKNYIAGKCYVCRAKVTRKKQEFSCKNGHKGNYFFNSAMNIGIMCLKKFGK